MTLTLESIFFVLYVCLLYLCRLTFLFVLVLSYEVLEATLGKASSYGESGIGLVPRLVAERRKRSIDATSGRAYELPDFGHAFCSC